MKFLTSLLSSLALCGIAFADVSETIQKSYPLSADGSLDLSNVNGSIEITAWDKNELKMEAVKKAKDEEHLNRIEVRVKATDSRISIETHHEKRFFGNTDGSVHYRLMVPATCKLSRINSVNSSVTVDGVTNDATINTVNGSIKIKGGTRSLDLHTVNGSIRAEHASFPNDGRIEIGTVNGSCSLELPGNTKDASVDAGSVNGKVSCAFPITLEQAGRRTIKGKIGQGGPRIKMRSVNGSLHIEKA